MMNELIPYVIIVSFNHVGDYNQALQTQRLFQNSHQLIFQVAVLDVEHPQFTEKLNQTEYDYVHSIGEKAMIKVANQVKENSQLLKNKQVIIQIHQHFEELLVIKPNFLIIPETNYRDHIELKQTRKILLMGTFFEKISCEKLQQIYNASTIKKDINLKDHYLIVMLSGDAPDELQMKYFTKQSADHLLMRIANLLGIQKAKGIQSIVIVQNGPRTGKHDPISGKQVCLHKFNHGEDPSIAIDQISKYFVNKLQQYHIKHLLYNFSFQNFQDKRVVNSFYKPLLYVAQQNQNTFLFPMQSISMISELPFYINPSYLYAFHTSSANESHMKFVEKGFQRGLYQMMTDKQWNILSPSNPAESKYDQIEEKMQIIAQYAKSKRKQSPIQK